VCVCVPYRQTDRLTINIGMNRHGHRQTVICRCISTSVYALFSKWLDIRVHNTGRWEGILDMVDSLYFNIVYPEFAQCKHTVVIDAKFFCVRL
jgi:hypothetical protein